MKKIIQITKNIVLFFCGIALFVWGYTVNAANANEKKKCDYPHLFLL